MDASKPALSSHKPTLSFIPSKSTSCDLMKELDELNQICAVLESYLNSPNSNNFQNPSSNHHQEAVATPLDQAKKEHIYENIDFLYPRCHPPSTTPLNDISPSSPRPYSICTSPSEPSPCSTTTSILHNSNPITASSVPRPQSICVSSNSAKHFHDPATSLESGNCETYDDVTVEPNSGTTTEENSLKLTSDASCSTRNPAPTVSPPLPQNLNAPVQSYSCRGPMPKKHLPPVSHQPGQPLSVAPSPPLASRRCQLAKVPSRQCDNSFNRFGVNQRSTCPEVATTPWGPVPNAALALDPTYRPDAWVIPSDRPTSTASAHLPAPLTNFAYPAVYSPLMRAAARRRSSDLLEESISFTQMNKVLKQKKAKNRNGCSSDDLQIGCSPRATRGVISAVGDAVHCSIQ